MSAFSEWMGWVSFEKERKLQGALIIKNDFNKAVFLWLPNSSLLKLKFYSKPL